MVELINTECFEELVKIVRNIVDEIKRVKVKDIKYAELEIDEDGNMYLDITKKDGTKLIIKENYDDRGKYYYIQYGSEERFIYDDKLVELIDDRILYKEFNRLSKEIEEFNDRKKKEIIKKYFSD